MVSAENELKALASAQTDWDIPALRSLEGSAGALVDMATAMMEESGWKGTAADAANTAFGNMRTNFAALESATTKLLAIIDAANGAKQRAVAKVDGLSSGEVDPGIVAAARTASVVIFRGTTLPADGAISFIEGILGDKREDEARKAVEELGDDLEVQRKDIHLVREGLQDFKPALGGGDVPPPEPIEPFVPRTPTYVWTPPAGPQGSAPTPIGSAPGDFAISQPVLNPGPSWVPNPGTSVDGDIPTGTSLPGHTTVPGGLSTLPGHGTLGGSLPGGGSGLGVGLGGGNGGGLGGGFGSGGMGAGIIGGGAAAAAAAAAKARLTGGGNGGGIGRIGAGGLGGANGVGAGGSANGAGGAGRLGAGGMGGAGGAGGVGGAGAGGAGATGTAGGAGRLGGGGLLGSQPGGGAGGGGNTTVATTNAAGAGGRGPGGMMGGGGGNEDRDKRGGLGGLMAPKLDDESDAAPRSAGASAGGRDQQPTD